MHEKMLRGRKILIVADEMFEDLELFYPMLRLREEGAEVVVAAKKDQAYKARTDCRCVLTRPTKSFQPRISTRS